MILQQYDSKCTISYLTLVSEFLQHYREFQSPSDVVKRLGANCFTDITDTPEIRLMDSCMPLPEGFDQRVFQFRESGNRRGMFDVAFHEGKLVNLRAQIFFQGWFAKVKAVIFNSLKLRPLINEIVGIESVHHDISTDTFYCGDYKGWIVTFHQVPGTPSVSIAITEKGYG